MAYFKKKQYDGTLYEFNHLEPMQFSVTDENVTYRVRVEYSHHCFTEDIENWHNIARRYDFNNDPRSLCTLRYNHSQRLPNIIAALPDKTVYVGQKLNYFVMRNTDLLGNGPPYLVFIGASKLRDKRKGDVLLFVQSAYPKPNMVQTGRPVKFNTLIASTAKKTKIIPGKSITIKRE